MNIELKEVFKQYRTASGEFDREVLSGLSIGFAQGDSIAVVGPSGSGKSTLLNILGALDKPTRGQVLFNGDDLWLMDDRARSEFRNRHVGFVFQLHHLLPQLSLLENTLVPLIPGNERAGMIKGRERAEELLSSLGLREKMNRRPGQLSVGECQRGAVVRALVNEPRFVLADEPTGSLDARTAEDMGDILSSINRDHGVAVIMVTHDEKLAARMNVIYHLEEGKLTRLSGIN